MCHSSRLRSVRRCSDERRPPPQALPRDRELLLAPVEPSSRPGLATSSARAVVPCFTRSHDMRDASACLGKMETAWHPRSPCMRLLLRDLQIHFPRMQA
jgi:hypothetical protein